MKHKKGRPAVMKKKTFIVDIYDTNNQTWQGTVEWIQEQKKQSFRSVLELLQLMETAVNEDTQDGS
jgi:hypothetical protein